MVDFIRPLAGVAPRGVLTSSIVIGNFLNFFWFRHLYFAVAMRLEGRKRILLVVMMASWPHS